MSKSVIIGISVLLLFVGSIQGGSTRLDRDIERRKKELALIQKELTQKKAEIADAKKREKGVLQEITLLGQSIYRNELLIQKLKDKERLLNFSLYETETTIDSITISIAHQKKLLEKRLRAMYKKGEPGFWELFLRGKSSTDLFENWYYMSRVVGYDKEMIRKYIQSQDELHENREKLTGRLSEIEMAASEQKNAFDELLEQQKEQKSSLDAIQSDREFQEKILKEFEDNQRLITKIVQKLEKKRQRRIAEAKRKAQKRAEKRKKEIARAEKMKNKKKVTELKKKLRRDLAEKERVEKVNNRKCWPVTGKIISKYGIHIDPKIKTKTRNLGIEIAGKLGTPVKSVTSGEVVMVGKLPGHGTGIVIDHGASFYSVYGHLNTVSVRSGQKLSVCQEIGSIGDEDSYNGPKLFFQINKGVKNIDPMQWLKSARR
ncbi:MAG: peptidoglycan DD-metalloendopeptidase family protein [Fibrobacterales bacterium]